MLAPAVIARYVARKIPTATRGVMFATGETALRNVAFISKLTTS
jgi:hypothetical protein